MSRTPKAIQGRIANALRGRIVAAFKSQGLKKATRTFALLGCDKYKLKSHLESLFLPGMSWDNWSYWGWHIDHIIPCAAFDLKKPEEQRRGFHYTNLQPMWRADNQRKSARLDFSLPCA
jgi:hypothetical protein